MPERRVDGSGLKEHSAVKGPERRERVGLPPRPFLYTLDQVAYLIALPIETLKLDFIYFEGRSAGKNPPRKMVARNISPPGQPPEWRIAEKELIRWMRHKGFRHYERSWIEH